ncbi:MAG: hypothetical protein Crog4KO_22490 [Crocinitomicaceae bacterium]
MTQLSNEQFLNRFQDSQFVMKTQAQIAKDFERLGHDTHPSLLAKAVSLEELQLIVEEMLANVVQMGESQTLQLLYIVDIPQAKFLALTTDPDFLSKGAYLIIRREALKVHLRSIY